MLRICDLSVSYDVVEVLRGVSMEVKAKECVALVGANGSGKSTILKAVSGLIKKNKGSISFEGREISHLEAYKRVDLGIVQVPEGRRVFPEMSVLDNLLVGAYNKKARKKTKENLDFVFQLFPRLFERKHQVGNTLSGGEQQMLAIGRALLEEPKLLMLDEPSLGLAPVIVDEVYQTLGTIYERGVSILLVEENIYRAFSVATRGYVLENGNIVLSGSRTDLLSTPFVKESYMDIKK